MHQDFLQSRGPTASLFLWVDYLRIRLPHFGVNKRHLIYWGPSPVREDQLRSRPSSSPSHAAAPTDPAGAPRHLDILSLSPLASPVLNKRRISVLESSENEPSKRTKVTGANEDESRTPPAGRESSPRLKQSMRNPSEGPVRSVQETVDDDNLAGSQSNLDGASEVELKPGSPRVLAPAPALVPLPPVSSPFLDALHPPAAHSPPRRPCIQGHENAVANELNTPKNIYSTMPHQTHTLPSTPQASSDHGSSPSASPPPRTPPSPLVHKDFTLGDINEMIKSREDIAGEMETRAAELIEAARKLREQGRQLKALGAFVRLGVHRSAGGGTVGIKAEKEGEGA